MEAVKLLVNYHHALLAMTRQRGLGRVRAARLPVVRSCIIMLLYLRQMRIPFDGIQSSDN